MSRLIFPICLLVAFIGSPQVEAAESSESFRQQREQMVQWQLEVRGVRNPAVLSAMRKVPRHQFVPKSLELLAYNDRPLPIGQGQTISQPYIVAYMTEVLDLEAGDKVLEIGTGSGYQAAILAEIVREVYTIEIVPELAETARERLGVLGYENVHVRHGDGYQGWPEHAPYDAIILTAAPEQIPQALLDQLKVGGRLVAPVGTLNQELRRITKQAGQVTQERLLPVRFVPMVKSKEGDRPG